MYKKLTRDITNRKCLINKKLVHCLTQAFMPSSLIKYRHFAWLNKKKRRISQHWAQNICHLTGRSRGTVSFARMSRNMFKFSVNQGLFYGYKKVSW